MLGRDARGNGNTPFNKQGPFILKIKLLLYFVYSVHDFLPLLWHPLKVEEIDQSTPMAQCVHIPAMK